MRVGLRSGYGWLQMTEGTGLNGLRVGGKVLFWSRAGGRAQCFAQLTLWTDWRLHFTPLNMAPAPNILANHTPLPLFVPHYQGPSHTLVFPGTTMNDNTSTTQDKKKKKKKKTTFPRVDWSANPRFASGSSIFEFSCFSSSSSTAFKFAIKTSVVERGLALLPNIARWETFHFLYPYLVSPSPSFTARHRKGKNNLRPTQVCTYRDLNSAVQSFRNSFGSTIEIIQVVSSSTHVVQYIRPVTFPIQAFRKFESLLVARFVLFPSQIITRYDLLYIYMLRIIRTW